LPVKQTGKEGETVVADETTVKPAAEKPAPVVEKKTEKKTTDDKSEEDKKKKTVDIYKVRQRYAKIEAALGQQFGNNRLLACLSSSPGQVGRADGYLLEGKELEFYLKKIRSKKEK